LGKRWSKQDIALLRLRYNSVSWTELMQLFPDRTKKAIEQKAVKLGLVRNHFSIRKGVFYLYATCSRHGRIHIDQIRWLGKNLNTAYCPYRYCNRKLRVLPRTGRLREKYRSVR